MERGRVQAPAGKPPRGTPAGEGAPCSSLGKFRAPHGPKRGAPAALAAQRLPAPTPRYPGRFPVLGNTSGWGTPKFFKSQNPPVPPSVVVFSPLELEALGVSPIKEKKKKKKKQARKQKKKSKCYWRAAILIPFSSSQRFLM